MRQFGSFWLDPRHDFIVEIRINARQLFEQHFVAGLFVDIMDIDIFDNSMTVDDKNSSFAVSARAQDTVSFGDRTMGPEIAQKRIMNSAQAFCPGR